MVDDKILKHYVTRVQLAVLELRDAKKHAELLALQLQMAQHQLDRCVAAEYASKHELAEYAGTGVRKVYCVTCDQFYIYTPAKDEPEPGCPNCNRASIGQEMLNGGAGPRARGQKMRPTEMLGKDAVDWMA